MMSMQTLRATLMQDIISAVVQASKIERKVLLGEAKSHVIVDARFVAMRIAKREGLSHARIGRALGGRDHTTVLSGVRAVERLIHAGTLRAAYIERIEDLAMRILAGERPSDLEPSVPHAEAPPVGRKSSLGAVNENGEIILHPWS